ncbi:amino acid adenylation domain-containing protein [Collinsella sp. An2]|uniref:amino acid adenylation domain-containing protein n=1 Tax=Collinsella sp. An2 TaxID=1965585 RepID=UPI001302907D|nr:amino acid adenylation domain-containing protein [Collinsella sp. An2]
MRPAGPMEAARVIDLRIGTHQRYRYTALCFLERGALLHPAKTAVVDELGSCTYGQLYGLVRRVGSALAARGCTGRAVIVCAEKSAETLAAMLGVLAAGGYYVPVDPAVPAERARSIYETLEQPVVIVDWRTRDRARMVFPGAELAPLDELTAAPIAADNLDRIARQVVDTDPAYVLFTSGSTGAPKGVAVSHRAIVEFISTFVRTLEIGSDEVLGNQAPFDFDVSVKDIYGAMAAGATLVILPRRLFSSPAELMDALAAHRVTTLIWAVAALCLLSRLHGLEHAELPCLRTVMFSGEVMPLEHLRRWRERLPRVRFVNLYGPTEVTCNCTYQVLAPGRSYDEGVPLGRPFPNRRVLLLDEAGRLVTEPGEVGELYVGGSALALGYVGDTERTRAAFVSSPLRSLVPETLYRTGDRARVGTEGELFFCGRVDNQVKHLGHRVELEEIDAAFERQPDVERCRTVYDARRERLCAFFEGSAAIGDLRRGVERYLPAALVPGRIVRVEAMPLTKNGKVDRLRLLELDENVHRRSVTATANKGASVKSAVRQPVKSSAHHTHPLALERSSS